MRREEWGSSRQKSALSLLTLGGGPSARVSVDTCPLPRPPKTWRAAIWPQI